MDGLGINRKHACNSLPLAIKELYIYIIYIWTYTCMYSQLHIQFYIYSLTCAPYIDIHRCTQKVNDKHKTVVHEIIEFRDFVNILVCLITHYVYTLTENV